MSQKFKNPSKTELVNVISPSVYKKVAAQNRSDIITAQLEIFNEKLTEMIKIFLKPENDELPREFKVSLNTIWNRCMIKECLEFCKTHSLIREMEDQGWFLDILLINLGCDSLGRCTSNGIGLWISDQPRAFEQYGLFKSKSKFAVREYNTIYQTWNDGISCSVSK
jgi:hypothetical protein